MVIKFLWIKKADLKNTLSNFILRNVIRLKILISTYTYPYILSTVRIFCVLGLNSKIQSLEMSQFLHTIETSVAITIANSLHSYLCIWGQRFSTLKNKKY